MGQCTLGLQTGGSQYMCRERRMRGLDPEGLCRPLSLSFPILLLPPASCPPGLGFSGSRTGNQAGTKEVW